MVKLRVSQGVYAISKSPQFLPQWLPLSVFSFSLRVSHFFQSLGFVLINEDPLQKVVRVMRRSTGSFNIPLDI